MPKTTPPPAGDTPTPDTAPAAAPEPAAPTREQFLAAAAEIVGQPDGPTREEFTALAEAAAYAAAGHDKAAVNEPTETPGE